MLIPRNCPRAEHEKRDERDEPDSHRAGNPQTSKSVMDGAERIEAMLRQARRRKVALICTGETYLPGMRGGGKKPLPPMG